MANYFNNGILNKPCKICGCAITPANCVIDSTSILSKCKSCFNKYKREKFNKFLKDNPKKMREYNLRSHRGIEIEQYNKILIKQNNTCAICKKENKSERIFAVDHDHKTGNIRELLCANCNAILGMCDDSIEILEAVINYLIKHTNIEKEFSFQHD